MEVKERIGMKPRVDEGAFVAPGADLIGQVHLAKGASVWYGAVLRGDCAAIEIGEGSNVQDLCVLHGDVGPQSELPVVLGKNVTVGHRAILHGCVIEDEVLVGMGAVVLSGARIGAGSVIAAGAVVKEGMQVPPRSLVAGIPAEVKKTIDEKVLERVRKNGEFYCLLAQDYLAAGIGRAGNK